MSTAVEPGRRVEVGLSWRAIFVGVVVGLVVQFVLTLLGLAVGLSRLDVVGHDANAKGIGIGAGLWVLAASLVAWFVGAFVSAWFSGCLHRGAGLVHGVAAWGIGLFVVLLLVGPSMMGAISAGFGILSERVELQQQSEEALRRLEELEPEEAQKAADAAARGAWEAFATAALSLGAAALGGASGARRIHRRIEGSQSERIARAVPPLPAPRTT